METNRFDSSSRRDSKAGSGAAACEFGRLIRKDCIAAATRKVYSWTVYSAVCLGRARFASVYNLLLGGSWAESLEEELPFAYDFLCDLYFDTGREDVLRTAEFLGRCISSGVEAAAALEAEGSTVTPRLQDWLEIDEHIPYV